MSFQKVSHKKSQYPSYIRYLILLFRRILPPGLIRRDPLLRGMNKMDVESIDNSALARRNSKWLQLVWYDINYVKYLYSKSLIRSAHALITLKTDYCNVLYVRLPLEEIWKLQQIQNAAAKMVWGISRYNHLAPFLAHLHWLLEFGMKPYNALMLAFRL